MLKISKRSKKAATAIVGIATIALSSMISSAAFATDAATDPPAGQPDQIIYIDGPAPQPPADAHVTYQQSTAGAEVTVTEGVEFPVVPKLGETVRIVYTDAVTELSTFADETNRGSCTVSLTVDSPSKTSNRAYVAARGSVSSACGSARTINLGLYEGGMQRADNSWGVLNNGSTFGSSARAGTCTYGFDTPFRGIAAWSFGGAVYGPIGNIACRYF